VLFQWDRKQVKIGLFGSLLVFAFVLIALKPHLPIAIYHNFAAIDDYRIFQNRVVKRGQVARPWQVSNLRKSMPNPDAQDLLRKLDTTALLMIQDGRIVFEEYFGDGGVSVLSGSFSMAKSIVSILAGFALQEGKLKSLEEPVSRYLPEWEGREEGRIRVLDLLRMTAGLDWNESYLNPFSITTEAYYGSNLLSTVFKQHRILDPGTVFAYQSGTTQLLGTVVSRAVNLPLSDFASSRLWGPMGAENDALWSLDHEDGMEKSYCCFYATARDFGRIGELVRNQGNWGDSKLLDSGYVSEMVRPHRILNSEGQPVDYYGYQWWILQTPKGEVPYARGILGQYIVVIPWNHRVIVRLGKATGERTDHHPVELRALVEWGLEDS
jgi:CubicO group peptidase (beta-lactamase class C family)